MFCEKCQSKMYIKESRQNVNLPERYRFYVCENCGEKMYTCECKVDFDTIRIEWKENERQRLKNIEGEKERKNECNNY